MKKKNRNEHLNRVSDALFGAPEDLGDAEAREDLEAAGIDREELLARMYEKLCAIASEYRLKKAQVPPILRKALEDLRQRVGPPRTNEEMSHRADFKVSKFLEAVKIPLSAVKNEGKLAFSVSYRNKTEQPTRDRQIIETLERELAKEIEEENDDQN